MEKLYVVGQWRQIDGGARFALAQSADALPETASVLVDRDRSGRLTAEKWDGDRPDWAAIKAAIHRA